MNHSEIDTISKEKIKIKQPKKYNVILHNDDVTTMDYVMFILIDIFDYTEDSAYKLMMDIHTKGKGIAGTFIKEIAFTKKLQVDNLNKEHGCSLLVTVEPEA